MRRTEKRGNRVLLLQRCCWCPRCLACARTGRQKARRQPLPATAPHSQQAFSIEKDFRGRHLAISVENPDAHESGVRALYVNGELLTGDYVPEAKLTARTEIRVVM